jgi:PRTRC genetic system protein C
MDTELTREFLMGSVRLPDPNPTLSPEEVRDLYAASYRHLADCIVESPQVIGDRLQIVFSPPPVKTKG